MKHFGVINEAHHGKTKTTRKNTAAATTRKSPGQICVSPRNNDNKKPQRPTTEATGKRKTPRDQTKGEPPTSLNVRHAIETERLDPTKSRIVRGIHRRSGVRQDREGGRGEGGRGSLRHTEHCIIMVELFVVLDCVGPAVLEGKGNWVDLFLCYSVPPQIGLLGAKCCKISCRWTSSELPAGKVKNSPVFL